MYVCLCLYNTLAPLPSPLFLIEDLPCCPPLSVIGPQKTLNIESSLRGAVQKKYFILSGHVC